MTAADGSATERARLGAVIAWCCPQCRRTLAKAGATYTCRACARTYPTVAGIPDLRVSAPAWIDFEDDLDRARELIEATEPDDVEGAVRLVFGRRPGWSPSMVERRTREVLASPERFRADAETWLAAVCGSEGVLLDLGCGAGGLLAALARLGRPAIGVDASMEWLVVAQRMIRGAGGTPALACALAEALPLADASVGAVAALDVIEHVDDRPALVRDLNRILRSGGQLGLATPNRFSFAAEPHVGVWGVGWLPRRFQAGFVQRRSGDPYRSVALLSARELRRLVHRNSELTLAIELPRIPERELKRFPRRRRAMAKGYNALVSRRRVSRALHIGGPFFHVTGVKRPGLPSA